MASTSSTANLRRPLGRLACVAVFVISACIGTPEEFQDTGVIVFLNQTPVSFIEVRVALCGTLEYGNNQLGNLAEVPPGREFRLRLSPGCFDARIVFFNGGLAAFTGIQVREDEESTVRVTTVS
ncbi:MAG: hypothetical protein L0271_11780 [Gemmatimonadetes bacterium]|nr:hypothetical protein [Gemmatimonadota bacterium]